MSMKLVRFRCSLNLRISNFTDSLTLLKKNILSNDLKE